MVTSVSIKYLYLYLFSALGSIFVDVSTERVKLEHILKASLYLLLMRCNAALEQTHASLKQHAAALEATLAERASSELESDSSTRDELGRRDQQIAELMERVEQLEQTLGKERQAAKDLRAQVCHAVIDDVFGGYSFVVIEILPIFFRSYGRYL